MKQVLTSTFILCCLFVFQKAQAQCTAPTNATAVYNNNVSTFSWDAVPGAAVYRIEMKFAFDPWTYPQYMTSVSTNSLSLTGIYHSAPLSWRVRAVCASDSSAWQEQNYTVPCPEPSALSATNITMSSADVSWTPAVGYNTTVSDFVIAYRKLGNSTWTSLGHTSAPSMTISNLLPNTTYEWCVNQSCPNAASNPVVEQFTTQACTSAGNNSQEWIRQFKLGTINRKSGADAGGYYNSNLSTDLVIGSIKNRGKFRAGFASGVQNQYYSIFIDFNGNGNYTDPGEKVVGPRLINTHKRRGFRLDVPSTATPGTYGMRVTMQRATTNVMTGCMSNFNGETEDYLVNLLATSNRPAKTGSATIAKNGDVKLYPNPSNGQFHIELPSQIIGTKFEVTSLAGQQILENNITDQVFTIDMSKYPAGIYVLSIVDESGEKHIFRLLKN